MSSINYDRGNCYIYNMRQLCNKTSFVVVINRTAIQVVNQIDERVRRLPFHCLLVYGKHVMGNAHMRCNWAVSTFV